SVYNLPTNPAYKNAVALVDGTTLLVGRYDTVSAALKNPKPGTVRFGLEAVNKNEPYYWIAGDDSQAHRWLSTHGIDTLEELFADSVRTRGVAVAFGGTAVQPGSAGAAGGGTPGMPGMPPGMSMPRPPSGPPGGAAPPGG